MNKNARLRVNDIAEGVVTALGKVGARVDLHGESVLLPLAEISWYEIEHPSVILRVGQRVKVKIVGRTQDGIWECTLRGTT